MNVIKLKVEHRRIYATSGKLPIVAGNRGEDCLLLESVPAEFSGELTLFLASESYGPEGFEITPGEPLEIPAEAIARPGRLGLCLRSVDGGKVVYTLGTSSGLGVVA